jgi:DNA-binding NtrC family response regulator
MLSDSEHIDARALGAFMGAESVTPEPELHDVSASEEDPIPYAQAMTAFEKQFLSDALHASGGRVAEAAQRIGIGRATMYKKIVALGIEV